MRDFILLQNVVWKDFDVAYGTGIIVLMLIIFAFTFYISNKAAKKVKEDENGFSLFSYGMAVLGSYFGLWLVVGTPGLGSISNAGFANYIALYLGLMVSLFILPQVYGKIIKISERYRVNSLYLFIVKRYGDSRFLNTIITTIGFIIALPIIVFPVHVIADLIKVFSGNAIGLPVAYVITLIFIFFFVNKLNPKNLRSIGSFNFLIALAIGLILFFISLGTGEQNTMTKHIVKPDSKLFISLFVLGFISMFTLPRQFNVIHSGLKINRSTYLKVIIVCFALVVPLFHLITPYTGWGGYLFNIKTGRDFNLKAFAVFTIILGSAFSTIGPQLNTFTRIMHEGLISRFFKKTKSALKWSFIASLIFNLVAIMIFSFVVVKLTKLFRIPVPAEYSQISTSFMLSRLYFASVIFLIVTAVLLFGGLYWKRGNKYGALVGFLLGSVTWAISLLLPMFSKVDVFSKITKLAYNTGAYTIASLGAVFVATLVGYVVFSLVTRKESVSLVNGYVSIEDVGVEFFISEDIQRFMVTTAQTPLKMELVAYFKDNSSNMYTLRDIMIRLFWKGDFDDAEVEEALKELAEKEFLGEVSAKGQTYYRYIVNTELDDIVENFTRSYYTAKQIFYKQAEEEFNRQSEILRKEKEKLSEEVDQLEVFMEASETLSKILDVELLYRQIAELATRNLGFDSSEIYTKNPDGTYVLKTIFYSNYGHLTQSEEHFNDLFRSDVKKQEILKSIEESGEPYIMNDPEQSGAEEKSVYAIFPLKEEGKTVAFIEFGYASKAKRFTDKEMNKLDVFLNTVFLAFASVRLFEGLEEKVRQRTAQLNKANEEAKELNTKLEDVNKEMKRERKVASQIQQAIVPKSMPKEKAMEIGYFWVPMTEVSGDYFDVIDIGGGKYGILIADVSGHGVPSALITTMAKIAFINHSKPDVATAEICTLVNKEIYAALGDIGFYLTAFYGIFDVNTMEFVYTNAGHQPGYWYQKSTDQIIELDSPGFFIGSFDGAEYGHNTVTLESGDKVVFFTDGIVEARNQKGDFFEDKRLRDFIHKNKNTGASEMANKLIGYVEEFAQGRAANDDRTAVILEVTGKRKAGDVKTKDKRIAEFINFFNIGARAAKEEKYEDALKAFQSALEISPSSAQVYVNIGHIYRKQKKYKDAKNMYEKALEIKDNLVEAYNSLGVVYFYMKDFNNAMKAFETTLKLNPKLRSASDNLRKIKQLLDKQN